MPNRLAYDEAITLGQARLKVPDLQLKQGSVAMTQLETTIGIFKRPWGQEGAFAIVYKFFKQNGEPCALRCFKGAMTQDMQTRYEHLGTYFQTYIPDLTARFTYYNLGIEVKEQGLAGSQTYPLIAMEWIEGETLLDRVDTLCRSRDQASLARLSEQWLALVRTLREAHIAHGDLAGGNVMLRKQDEKLVLVDYDGAFIPVPEFQSLPPVVQGQPDYQHPQWKQRRFDEWMDSFSALSIYTALLALRVEPRLWNTYMDQAASGHPSDRNLLFTQDDFADPAQSEVLREIEGFSDPQLQAAVQELKRACEQPIDEVRWSLQVIEPDYERRQAFDLLYEAVSRDDEEGMIQQWTPLLEDYPPARSYAPLVERSRMRIELRRRFREALERRHAREILAAYDDLQQEGGHGAEAEQAFVERVRSWLAAFQSDKDAAIAAAWNQMLRFHDETRLTVEPEEAERNRLALRSQSVVAQWREVLNRPEVSAQQVVALYDTHASLLDAHPGVTAAERSTLDLARQFCTMYQNVLAAMQVNGGGDDAQIRAAYDDTLAAHFADFTPEQRLRIAQARDLFQVEEALKNGDFRRALELAQAFEQAHHGTTSDFRVSLAKQRFIRQYDLTHLEVSLRGSTLQARWHWPDEKYVQHALVCWRPDRWPEHPRKQEQGTQGKWFPRRAYQHPAGVTIPLGQSGQPWKQVYVRVYAALRDEWANWYQPAWYYSEGYEPTARGLARLEANH